MNFLFSFCLSLTMAYCCFASNSKYTESHNLSTKTRELSYTHEWYASPPENHIDASVSEATIDLTLKDAFHYINQDFHVIPEIKSSVEFWLRIYTQYTTKQIVIFDSVHPEIIYEVLDFKPLAKKAKNNVVFEILSKRRITSTIMAYRSAFARLKKIKNRPVNLNREERLIFSAIKKLKHRHSYSELLSNLRTQTGQRDNIIRGLLAAEMYLGKMEIIFERLGLPPELTRLSLVESSFNLRAISRAGATGVWQFMLPSGKEFLYIDHKNGIDERLSPLKATVAAAKLLKRNYKLLGNWVLAVTSYNHGTRNLRKLAARDPDTSKIADLLRPCGKSRHLGWASRNYYAEFMAILHAEAYRNILYGDLPRIPLRPVSFIRVTKSQSALALAINKSVSLYEFKQLNPDIKELNHRLPVGFYVAMPSSNDDITPIINFRYTKQRLTKKRLISSNYTNNTR